MSRAPLVLVLLVAAAAAQSFTYSDFSSVAGLALNMSAAQSGNVLRVTSAVISQRGSAWYGTPVPVASGFETTFTFQFTAPAAGGGDGLAFVIQADPRYTTAIGNHAGALGYGAFVNAPPGTAIANSVAIELDTYLGPFGGYTDLSGNEISVHTGGAGDNSQSEGFSIGRVNAAVNMSNLQVHTLRIRYFPGRLEVFLDSQVPTLTVPYDLVAGSTQILTGLPVGGLNLLMGGMAIVGFTASNGAAWENHDVLSWSWTSFEDRLSGSVGAGVGGPYDVLLVNGTGGGPGRTVTLGSGQALAVDLIVPPSSSLTSANLLILADPLSPQIGGSFPTPFGTLAFLPPLPGLPATSITLFDTFGFGLGAILPATPAPFTLSLPGGVASPFQFVLQGIIEAGPGLIAVTNAVTLAVL